VNPTTATWQAAGYLIRRACRRLPTDTGDECQREWTAETWAILHDTTIRPAPRRHLAALRYAADHTRGTRHHPHALRLKRIRIATPARQRIERAGSVFALVVIVVGIVASIASGIFRGSSRTTDFVPTVVVAAAVVAAVIVPVAAEYLATRFQRARKGQTRSRDPS
jgi:hypothetical protein